MSRIALLAAGFVLATSAIAQIRITEWQYNGDEFIEFTNVGGTPVDMTGWSCDDDSRVPGTFSLSAFAVVGPGNSVILCESTAAAFMTNWRLTGVVVIGGNVANLGRADEINLYDAGNALVDRLTFGDQTFAGSIRTNDVSGSPCHGALGANDVYGWSLAYVGDARGSVRSVGGQVGNPGSYVAIHASLTTYGAGCPGTGSLVPDLAARGCPTLGGQAILLITNGAAAAPSVLMFGVARASFPIGNCTLHVDPLLAMLPVTLDPNGRLTLPIAIPTTIVPAILTTQLGMVDAGAPDGFTLTNGLELDIR